MGRPSKGERALSRQVFLRLTPADHEKFRALGGPRWLRAMLAEAAPVPTAHQPFPAIRDTNPDEGLSAYERYHGI